MTIYIYLELFLWNVYIFILCVFIRLERRNTNNFATNKNSTKYLREIFASRKSNEKWNMPSYWFFKYENYNVCKIYVSCIFFLLSVLQFFYRVFHCLFCRIFTIDLFRTAFTTVKLKIWKYVFLYADTCYILHQFSKLTVSFSVHHCFQMR